MAKDKEIVPPGHKRDLTPPRETNDRVTLYTISQPMKNGHDDTTGIVEIHDLQSGARVQQEVNDKQRVVLVGEPVDRDLVSQALLIYSLVRYSPCENNQNVDSESAEQAIPVDLSALYQNAAIRY